MYAVLEVASKYNGTNYLFLFTVLHVTRLRPEKLLGLLLLWIILWIPTLWFYKQKKTHISVYDFLFISIVILAIWTRCIRPQCFDTCAEFRSLHRMAVAFDEFSPDIPSTIVPVVGMPHIGTFWKYNQMKAQLNLCMKRLILFNK